MVSISHFVIVVAAWWLAVGGLVFSTDGAVYADESSSSTSDILDRAAELEKSKKLAEAQTLLLDHLRSHLSDAAVASKICDILLQRGDARKSLKIAKLISKHFPAYDWPYVLRFKAALELKNFAEARSDLDRLADLDTEANLNVLNGDYHRAKGDFLVADQFYAKALTETPSSTEIRNLRFWNLKNALNKRIDAGDHAEALSIISKMGELEGDDLRAETKSLSAILKLKTGDIIGAEQDLSGIESIKRKASYADQLVDIRVTLASQAYGSGDFSGAKKWLNAADEIKTVYNSLGIRANILRDEGDFENAKNLYKQAETLRANDPNLYEAMAWNFTQWNKLDPADAAILTAIKLSPNNPRFRVIRATQLKNARRLSEALAELIKAKKICTKYHNCADFDSIYDERFFETTSAEGVALKNIGLPLTIAGSLAYTEELTDIVSVTRGLAIQNVGREKFSLFFSPQKSPVLSGQMRLQYYKPNSRFFAFHYDRIQKIGGRRDDDPSVANLKQSAAIETETAFGLNYLGNISLFPYLKINTTDAYAVDTSHARGAYIRSNEYIAGARGLWLFRWYLPAIEGEVGFGRIFEKSARVATTLRGRAAVQQKFTKFIKFNIEGSRYSKLLDNKIQQGIDQSYVKVNIFPESLIRFNSTYELLSTKDASSNLMSTDQEGYLKTNHRTANGGLGLALTDSIKLEASYSKIVVEPYKAYDRKVINYDLEILGRKRLVRSITGGLDLPYQVPVRVNVGHNVVLFQRPKNLSNDDVFLTKNLFSSYYLSMRLFW